MIKVDKTVYLKLADARHGSIFIDSYNISLQPMLVLDDVVF